MRALLEVYSPSEEGDWLYQPFDKDLDFPIIKLSTETFDALGQPQYIEVNIQALPRSQNATG